MTPVKRQKKYDSTAIVQSERQLDATTKGQQKKNDRVQSKLNYKIRDGGPFTSRKIQQVYEQSSTDTPTEDQVTLPSTRMKMSRDKNRSLKQNMGLRLVNNESAMTLGSKHTTPRKQLITQSLRLSKKQPAVASYMKETITSRKKIINPEKKHPKISSIKMQEPEKQQKFANPKK